MWNVRAESGSFVHNNIIRVMMLCMHNNMHNMHNNMHNNIIREMMLCMLVLPHI